MRPTLAELRADLAAFAGREVVAFGSWCGPDWSSRSDVDIALVTRSRDRRANERTWWESLGRAPDRYDVRVFELLPIHVRVDIALRHVVVFGDPGEIGEYFHPAFRQWTDVQQRYEPPLSPRERFARLRSDRPFSKA